MAYVNVDMSKEDVKWVKHVTCVNPSYTNDDAFGGTILSEGKNEVLEGEIIIRIVEREGKLVAVLQKVDGRKLSKIGEYSYHHEFFYLCRKVYNELYKIGKEKRKREHIKKVKSSLTIGSKVYYLIKGNSFVKDNLQDGVVKGITEKSATIGNGESEKKVNKQLSKVYLPEDIS